MKFHQPTSSEGANILVPVIEGTILMGICQIKMIKHIIYSVTNLVFY